MVRQDVTCEALVVQAGGRDLIIAEDMNPVSKLSAGVMIIANTPFSRKLWSSVWVADRWFAKKFHEQTAIARYLSANERGFGACNPWFSYLGATTPHRTDHVAVFSYHKLNSNHGSFQFRKHQRIKREDRVADHSEAEGYKRVEFVFHAVGCSPKIAALNDVLDKTGNRRRGGSPPLQLLAPSWGAHRPKPIGDAGLAHMVADLAASPFDFLGLDKCGLTDAAVPTILQLLGARKHWLGGADSAAAGAVAEGADGGAGGAAPYLNPAADAAANTLVLGQQHEPGLGLGLDFDTLHLCNNAFTDAGIVPLAAGLADARIRAVYCSRVKVGALGAAALAQAAVTNVGIALLDISCCGLAKNPSVLAELEAAVASRSGRHTAAQAAAAGDKGAGVAARQDAPTDAAPPHAKELVTAELQLQGTEWDDALTSCVRAVTLGFLVPPAHVDWDTAVQPGAALHATVRQPSAPQSAGVCARVARTFATTLLLSARLFHLGGAVLPGLCARRKECRHPWLCTSESRRRADMPRFYLRTSRRGDLR